MTGPMNSMKIARNTAAESRGHPNPNCVYCNKHFSNWKALYYHICQIEEYEKADWNKAYSKQGQAILATSEESIQQEVNDENMKIPEAILTGGSNKGGLPFLKAQDMGYTL